MAKSKIYLGSTNIGSLFQGADDISIYLGEERIYPLIPKLSAKYIGGSDYVTLGYCKSSNNYITSADTRPSGYEYSAMTDAIIGDCVTTIEDFAFRDCTSLSSCTIGNSVTSIGSSAFNSCSGLASINIPSGVTTIGNAAFFKCSGLTSMNLPNSLTEIRGEAFRDCTSLASINIPSGVTSIGNGAFRRCRSLTSVVIPNGVTSINQYTFNGCSNLTSVTIGNGVTSIGFNAFSSCNSLTSITIPDNVRSIGINSFNQSTGLTSVTIGSGITSIDTGAFNDCSGLTSITVNATTPPTLATNGVFDNTNNCPIYVPCDSVDDYKRDSGWSRYASRITCVQPPFESKWKATYSDGNVTSAECDSSSEIVSGEIGPSRLVSVEIGNCVTSIGDNAFTSYQSLTSVTIPNSVTSIGEDAFNGCMSLISITVEAETPPTLVGIPIFIFYDTNNCPIYVPCDSVEAYKNAWSQYADRIVCPFEGKWKATYSDGSVTSAECDSSSAITYNEISLTNLVSVEIGNCVTSIGDYAFLYCSGMTSIDIPSSVTSIGNSAFQECTNLTSATIGNGVTSIAYDAFLSCTGLTSITVEAATPPTLGGGAFNNTNDCPIYVPSASLTAYQTAWSEYRSRLYPIE